MTFDIVTATYSDFEPYVGSVFCVETPDGPIDLILDNVKRHENLPVRDNRLEIDGRVLPPREPFALTFEGPKDLKLPSNTYTVRHAEIGEHALFISQFRLDRDCSLFESPFS